MISTASLRLRIGAKKEERGEIQLSRKKPAPLNKRDLFFCEDFSFLLVCLG